MRSTTFEGKKLAMVVTMKPRGQEQLVQRPALDACHGCYSWWLDNINGLYAWIEFYTKFWADAKFQRLITNAEQITAGEKAPDFPQCEACEVQEQAGNFRRASQVLSEAQLCRLAGVQYIPRRELKGPTVWAPKEHGPGLELKYVYKSTSHPFMEYVEEVSSKEVQSRVAVTANQHVWNGKDEVMSSLPTQRQQQSGARENLGERQAPLPDLAEWAYRVGGVQIDDTPVPMDVDPEGKREAGEGMDALCGNASHNSFNSDLAERHVVGVAASCVGAPTYVVAVRDAPASPVRRLRVGTKRSPMHQAVMEAISTPAKTPPRTGPPDRDNDVGALDSISNIGDADGEGPL